MSYVIVGLGNPGDEYKDTRHNVGFMVLDRIAKEVGVEWELVAKKQALVAEGKIGKEKVVLAKPQTFMNRSGNAVGFFIKSQKAAEKLIVVHDDLDIPLGKLKVSFGKSSGGHKGVESVMKAVKTQNFARVRVGITPTTATGKLKKPSGDAVVNDFIVDPFKKGEEDNIKKVIKIASEAVLMTVAEGREKAMGEFNRL